MRRTRSVSAAGAHLGPGRRRRCALGPGGGGPFKGPPPPSARAPGFLSPGGAAGWARRRGGCAGRPSPGGPGLRRFLQERPGAAQGAERASGGGAVRGGAGRRAPEGERAGGHGGFRASPGGGRLAGRAEPSRGLAGAGPGSRGRRRPGPPPAPPTLAQRAAAASPLRMSRKGPRAEVCADCSAPGKRGRAGGGTAHRGAAGRAPGPGGRAVRGRRAGRGWGLRPPVSAPARAAAEPRPWREGRSGGRGLLASVDQRGRTFPAPPPAPQLAPPTLPRSPRLPSLDPNGSASLGWPGGLWRRPAGLRRWGRVWFCVIAGPPPRLAPAALLVCAPAGVAEGKGQKARQMGRRGVGVVWILFSQEQTAGWLLLGLPAPGSQGSSQGLVFRATTSLGIVP